jgi:hypothetical protein
MPELLVDVVGLLVLATAVFGGIKYYRNTKRK